MDNLTVENLEQENIQLKKERKELYNQLKKLNQKLEESDSFKSHFLSNISNEIINPFTSILGISQNILQMKVADLSKIQSMTNLIFNEALDLDFQLRNIFAAAKIESGEKNLELVEIKTESFLNEIIESLRLKAEKNALYFEFTHFLAIETFVVDPDKLRLTLTNLIMNAITFSAPKNKIRIHAELNKEGFAFRINNLGNPIHENDFQIIFDRFKKLNNSINSLNQGHGIGLSIIKDYTEFMGGTIQVESSQAEGTTFSIHIPPIELKDKALFMDEEDLFSTEDSELF
ncbi:MAG: HAMP domain-containing histidine kinase [Bacteroidales bacterium]|nr:HAMP domain-containing histidine kinase [Bacteroidales bacterium]